MSMWRKIIKQLMAERRISERELASRAGVHRSTFRAILAGTGRLSVDNLDAILSTLGYSLAAFDKDGNIVCRSQLPASVAARSSLTGNAAHVRSTQPARAKPASTNSVRPHANAATTANGGKPAKPSSPSIGRV